MWDNGRRVASACFWSAWEINWSFGVKACHRCAEQIQDAALVCRYCGAKQKRTDWTRVLVLIGIILFVAAVSGSNSGEKTAGESGAVPVGESVIAEPYDKYTATPPQPTAAAKRGPTVPVWSDPKATYTDEGSGELANGNLWIITRRDGPSGVSFSKREIDCAAETFRYMAEGDALNSMSASNDATLGQLTEGSISTLVSDYACRKHGRGRVSGV
jgi:hypothetical protein